MNDLISRKTAIKAIEELQDCYNGFSDSYDKACIIGVLEELPPADAAPVVRCKDCRYWDAFPSSSIAPEFHKCKGLGVHTVADFFCSKGERADG